MKVQKIQWEQLAYVNTTSACVGMAMALPVAGDREGVGVDAEAEGNLV